jgi:outer membrane protein assembly factor BamB
MCTISARHSVPDRPSRLWMATGLLLAAATLTARGDEWTQWRGTDGSGHAPLANDLPVTWSETENVAWKTPLPGRGWSSPVVSGDRIWMTTALEREASPEEKAKRLEGVKNAKTLGVVASLSLRALCVDRTTGKLLHDVELLEVDTPQPIHSLNSYASPSPILADGRLYCHFGDYGTACVDTVTAEVVWANRELRLEHVNGPGSTPVLWRNLLIVHCDGSDTQSIAALDTASGRLAWRTPRSGTMRDDPDLKKAYGTPLLLQLGGKHVLVSPAADWLYAYDPANGSELWKAEYGVLGFSVVPKPVFAHGLVFTSTSFMSPEILAWKLDGAGGPPTIAWREKRAAPNMPSLLVAGDELYTVSDKGVAACYDARTGEPRWTERLGGNFSSSPVFADGRIYVGNRNGDTFVLRPGKTYELLATNHLDGQIMATPVPLGRAIYLRTDQAIYRIEKPR